MVLLSGIDGLRTVEECCGLATHICWCWRCAGAGGCLKALLTGRLMHCSGTLGDISQIRGEADGVEDAAIRPSTLGKGLVEAGVSVARGSTSLYKQHLKYEVTRGICCRCSARTPDQCPAERGHGSFQLHGHSRGSSAVMWGGKQSTRGGLIDKKVHVWKIHLMTKHSVHDRSLVRKNVCPSPSVG